MAPVRELPTVAAGSPGLKRPAPGGHFGAFAPGVGFQNRPPLPRPSRPPMTSVSAPQVSFCIPTYNRCRYLASLLESLVVQLADFPFSYELVIADNASTDATAETIAAYADRLPIRALAPRHQHRRLRQLAVRAGAGGRALRRLRRRRRQHPRQPGRERRRQDGSRPGARRRLRAVAAVRPGRAAVAGPVLHRPARPAHRAQRARAAARPRPAPPHLSRDPDHSPRRPAGDDAARQRARVLRLRPCRRLPDAGRHPDPAPAVLRLDHALLRGRRSASSSATARSSTPGIATAAASST